MGLLQNVIKSSSFLIASKMLQRLIGLISIMVLARLLTPDDFAVVALTAIIIYFFDMLSNVGTEQYIIQKTEVTHQDLNTAWTIDLISKGILWLILISSASAMSDYFEQPQLQHAIYVMSLLLPINALKNPGTFLLKSELNYKSLFCLTLIQKLSSFFVVITIAFISPSFWALIIADLIASLIFLIGSYQIHSFRPSLSLIKGGEQWLFSKWLLLKGIVGYIRSQIDTLFISKLFSPAILGQYYMVRNVSMLANHNILAPAIEPLLAAFKTQKSDKDALSFQVRVSLFVVSLIITPISFFIWYFPEPIIDTLLGEQWVSSYSLMSSLALITFYFPFLLVLEQVMLVHKKLVQQLLFDVFTVLAIAAAFYGIVYDSINDLALMRGGLGIVSCSILIFYVHFVCEVNLAQFARLLSPSILAGLLASFTVNQFSFHDFNYAVIKLIFIGGTFTLCYISFVCILLKLFFMNYLEVKFILNRLKPT